MAIWLPGYERVDLGLDGKPFEYTHNPKGLLHRTEGSTLAGAESAMRAYPSHLGYDLWTREKHQYISLDLAAYSAMDESDNDPIYQVELVGFSKDSRYLPDWALRNIAEDVIKPLADTVGIPPVMIRHGFKDGLDGIYPYLASPQSPIRISYAELRAFSGWLGHQHLPAPDDHWDPGAINMARLIELAYGDDMSWTERLPDRQGGSAEAGEFLTGTWDKLSAPIPVPGQGRTTDLRDEIGYLPVYFQKLHARLDELEQEVQALRTGTNYTLDQIAQALVAELKKEGN